MKLYGFGKGCDVPKEVLSHTRNEVDLEESFCVLAGYESSKPIYVLVKCHGYGCQTEIIWNGNAENLGYMYRAGAKEAMALCEFINGNKECKNFRSTSLQVDKFYHDFYSGKIYSEHNLEK